MQNEKELLARQKSYMQIFMDENNIYCDMTKAIFGLPVKNKRHPTERQFCKQAILGLGFKYE